MTPAFCNSCGNTSFVVLRSNLNTCTLECEFCSRQVVINNPQDAEDTSLTQTQVELVEHQFNIEQPENYIP